MSGLPAGLRAYLSAPSLQPLWPVLIVDVASPRYLLAMKLAARHLPIISVPAGDILMSGQSG